MQKKISVIIPTLNEERDLPRLLNDFQKQTKKNFEIIIVDAQSEDKTIEKALKFKDTLALTVVESDMANVSHQRNLGALHAKEDYLFFIDADSQITSTCIERLIQCINDYRFLIFQLTLIPNSSSYSDEVLFNVINYGVELSQRINQPMSNGGSMVMHKVVFEQLNGFDEKMYLSEDHDLIKRAQNIGISAKYLKNVKLKVSLRRLKKDGFIPILYKYSLAFIYSLAKGRIDKKLFDYEMGGAAYDVKPSKEQFRQIKKLYHLLKNILEE